MIIASLLLILAAAVLLVLGLLRNLDLLLVGSIAVSLVAAVALYVGARQSRTADDDPPGRQGDPEQPRERDRRESPDTGRSAMSEYGAGRSGQMNRADLPSRAQGESRTAAAPTWPLERRPARSADREYLDRSTSDRTSEWATSDRSSAIPDESMRQWTELLRDGAQPPDARSERSALGERPTERSDDVPADEPPAQRTPRSDAELIARLPAEVFVVDGRPRYHVTGCHHLRGRDGEPLPVAEAVELGFTPCAWCQPDTVLLGGTPGS